MFDARYDAYRGVVLYVRVVDGRLASGDRVRFMHTGREYEVHEVGLKPTAPRGIPRPRRGRGPAT